MRLSTCGRDLDVVFAVLVDDWQYGRSRASLGSACAPGLASHAGVVCCAIWCVSDQQARLGQQDAMYMCATHRCCHYRIKNAQTLLCGQGTAAATSGCRGAWTILTVGAACMLQHFKNPLGTSVAVKSTWSSMVLRISCGSRCHTVCTYTVACTFACTVTCTAASRGNSVGCYDMEDLCTVVTRMMRVLHCSAAAGSVPAAPGVTSLPCSPGPDGRSCCGTGTCCSLERTHFATWQTGV
jgi:hypothetical protein